MRSTVQYCEEWSTVWNGVSWEVEYREEWSFEGGVISRGVEFRGKWNIVRSGVS